jgi:cyclopropane fatty-acyl-phospholipid synthase-like methyltransferase
MNEEIRARFFDSAVRLGAYSNAHNLRRHLDYIFDGVDLAGKCLLDVGGGAGLLTVYAATKGAVSVCVEPEGPSSTGGVTKRFGMLKNAVDPGLRAEIVVSSVQEYLREPRNFDVVVIANAINHLNEDACIKLLSEPAAREEYKAILCAFFHCLKPGGQLIATDCGNSNVFNDIGMKSPFMPDIEWQKHQPPEVWDELLQEVGFAPAQVQWSTPNTLGAAGRSLFGNKISAYFLLSHFRLAARKPGLLKNPA